MSDKTKMPFNERRGLMAGRRDEDNARIDRDVSFWRTAAIGILTFSVGTIGTLMGAWATHSVTQEELNNALKQQNTQYMLSLDVVKTTLETVVTNQENSMKKLDGLKEQVDKATR